MQWCAMRGADELLDIRRRLRELARGSPVNFRFHWVERSLIEGALARGDRRLGRVIEAAWRRGARMDSWNEHWNASHWTAAFEAEGVDPAAIANVELPVGAPLPWSHIRCCRAEAHLAAEHARMLEALRG
jgi:hypothetical protein